MPNCSALKWLPLLSLLYYVLNLFVFFQALLPHYPSKFQNLRRCISLNSYFIFTMLQAFEPPLDMSQDVDGCKDPHLENFEHGHCHSEERNASSCQSVSTSGRMCCSNHAQACSQEKSNIMSNPTTEKFDFCR